MHERAWESAGMGVVCCARDTRLIPDGCWASRAPGQFENRNSGTAFGSYESSLHAPQSLHNRAESIRAPAVNGRR